MEGGGKTDQYYDVFEMLLGEIPIATLSHPQSGEHDTTDLSQKLGTVSINDEGKFSPSRNVIQSSNSPQPSKPGANVFLYGNLNSPKDSSDQETQSNGMIKPKKPVIKQRYFRSLSGSTFEESSSNDGVAMQPTTLSSYPSSSSDRSFILDTRDTLLRPPSGVNHAKMPLCSSATTTTEPPCLRCTTPNAVHFSGMNSEARSNGDNEFGAKMDSRNDLELFIKKELDYFHGECQEQQQIFSMALNAENHAFQFRPSAYQQQYCFDQQSGCTAPHDSMQRNMAWQNMAAEKEYYDMYPQLFYPTHIQNQGVQVHEIPNSIVSGMRSSTWTNIGPNFGHPDSHHIQPLNRHLHWNSSFLHERQNEFNISAMKGDLYQSQNLTSANGLNCSAEDFFGPQAVNKKQIFPEKILTRSHGMNSLKYSSSTYDGINRSASVANNNRKLHSESFVQQPLGLSNGYFGFDGLNCQDSSFRTNGLMAALKSSQMKYTSLDDVRGRIYLMAKDQTGCRFLQKIFAGGSLEHIEMIFVEIISHIDELMTDPFGNYLVQKLLEVCNEDQRMRILHKITGRPGELFRISRDVHGTRAVQKVIESLQTVEQIFTIIAALKPYVIPLMKDVNGNHVAQRCLQYLPPECCQFLFDTAEAHCADLAADRQGCCVLQKCLYYSSGDRKNRLMSKIIAYSRILAEDKYGNYVVQFILEQNVPWATNLILDQLDGHYADLSMQKYSSNVVERCLRHAEDKRRAAIVLELLNSPMLLEIMEHQYGNYVIQSVLKESKGALRAAFIEAIKPHVSSLRENHYGRKVLYSICTKK